ncbi:MBL fold metallo-hydrolase [Pedobacter quisquiliarum]|uniref:MBL fold metallo-hydrolase n=2 Tax=Pedobacter quisquiliarum TaxID=1834438 RepID=A0A916XAQ4_9SPHI|nr:MBL fold metallo-hydrolase [Pedobacter quisquiliarum]
MWLDYEANDLLENMKIIKRMILSLICLLLLLIGATLIYMQQQKFGKAPNREYLDLIKKSPNYKDGKFQNRHFTPMITEGYSFLSVTYDFIVTKFPRTKPTAAIPSIKTDLKNLARTENVLIWFGHSSYFLQLNGKRFLIDPIFSGNASPVPNSTKAFPGTDVYAAADFPEIDYLLITHDHYDHLDYETILQLAPKIRHVVCGLGVGAHFRHWKFDSTKIVEKDWDEKVVIDDQMTLHTATARHFSGRGFTRNNTLWLSFILQTPSFKIYLGGDSGYDTHFKELGQKFGGFDLAILENGQYNEAWHEIHMLPEEVLTAAQELNAKRLFPVHSGKFALAFHPWDEPLIRLSKHNRDKYQLPLVTPIIGEIVYLDKPNQVFKEWWKDVEF